MTYVKAMCPHGKKIDFEQCDLCEPPNQCDGCITGMPLDNGIHRMAGKAEMTCQTERYAHSAGEKP